MEKLAKNGEKGQNCYPLSPGRWLSHGLPKHDERLCFAWLKVFCRSLPEEDRTQRAANAASNGLRVHTSHFLNRDKKWAGEQLRLQDWAMPKAHKVSSVPSKQGEELKEEYFTLDGDAGARPRRKKKKSSASATFVSPLGRDMGTALSGRALSPGAAPHTLPAARGGLRACATCSI